jgi:hypothetical protein
MLKVMGSNSFFYGVESISDIGNTYVTLCHRLKKRSAVFDFLDGTATLQFFVP